MNGEGPPDDEFRPRPLMGRGFWVLMVFALVCVIAGIAVATLGPRLSPPAPDPSESGAP